MSCKVLDPLFQLLRRFNDLMLVVTLGKDEECQVCFEGLKLRETSRFSVRKYGSAAPS